MSNISVCIPRIESTITRQIIKDAFENFGIIDRIDIVNSGRRSRKAFIHFKKWHTRKLDNTSFLSRLQDGETVNFVYEFPWYWQCRKSYLPKPIYYNYVSV